MDIPQDIIDNVIAAVGDDTDTLKQCSLVSSSFLLPSRKRLFSRITLGSDRACQRIHQFLVQNTVIQSSVRAITLTEYIDPHLPHFDQNSECQWINSASLLAILRLPFRCLERFSITVGPDGWDLRPWNWNSFNSELKDALSNIMHSSNLNTLYLKGVTKMPITFFLHIVHLTTLELHSISPMDFCYEISSSESLTSAASTPTASHLVIDRCIWEYPECLPFEYASRAISIFLPFMCRLRLLEIRVDISSFTRMLSSLSINLTSPVTIEHLKFYITFCRTDDHDDHLGCYTSYEYLRGAHFWNHLDSITTHPSGSRLQRVDINIYYCHALDSDWDFHDANEVLKAVLDVLPLLRTKDILFVGARESFHVTLY